MKATHPKVQFWKRAAMIFAVLTVLAGVFGVVGTIIGMLGAFQTMEDGQGGDPEQLADNVSIAISTTAIGLGFSALFGLCLIGTAIRLVVLSKRS